MTTGPQAPADGHRGNGQHGTGGGRPRPERPGAQLARLAGFWALVLRRFRDYAQRVTGPAGNGSRTKEADDVGR